MNTSVWKKDDDEEKDGSKNEKNLSDEDKKKLEDDKGMIKKIEKELNNINLLGGKKTYGDSEEFHYAIEAKQFDWNLNNNVNAATSSLGFQKKGYKWTPSISEKRLENIENMGTAQAMQLEEIRADQMKMATRNESIEKEIVELKKLVISEKSREVWERTVSSPNMIQRKDVYRRGQNSEDGEICTSAHCPCPCRHTSFLNEPRQGISSRKDIKNKRLNRTASGGGGGGGSSGDSSSESDSESNDDRPGKSRDRKNRDQWKEAIEQNDEYLISRLLERGIYPDYSLLKQAYERHGPCSRAMKMICDGVERAICKTNKNIVSVVPTYYFDRQNEIVFIVYLKKKSPDTISFRNYDLKVRVLGKYEPEGKEIARKEDANNCRFSDNDKLLAAECIRKNSAQLFDQHSNLQMISASNYRSTCFGKEDAYTENRLCIVLYVSVKYYIPITEEKFPIEIDGIQTDVREGGFKFLSNAKEFHENIKMGCGISGERKMWGSIGPFFKEEGKTYFLTSSHVFFDMKEIPPDASAYDWKATEIEKGPKTEVYQPHINFKTFNKPVGKVFCAFYKSGVGDIPGMEIAVVRIEDPERIPVNGEFPDSENVAMDTSGDNIHERSNEPLTYETGEVIEKDFIRNNCCVEVLKFGAKTGKTVSRVNNFCSAVRGQLSDNDGRPALNNQIEVLEKHDGVKFARNGDSGSLILASINGDLRALGLLVGKASTGRILVTPIYAILDELGKLGLSQRSFLKFNRQTNSQVSSDSGISPDSLTDSIDFTNPAISQRITEQSIGNESRFGAIEKDVTELKENVNKLEATVSNIIQKLVG